MADKIADLIQKLASNPAFSEVEFNGDVKARMKAGNVVARDFLTKRSDTEVVEIHVQTAPGQPDVIEVRAPLTSTLTKEQIEQTAPAALTIAYGLQHANLGLCEGRYKLTMRASLASFPEKLTSSKDWADKFISKSVENCSRIASGIRKDVVGQASFGFNVANDKIYQARFGLPVKLTAAETAIAYGGWIGWTGIMNWTGGGAATGGAVGTIGGAIAGTAPGVTAGTGTAGGAVTGGGLGAAVGGATGFVAGVGTVVYGAYWDLWF